MANILSTVVLHNNLDGIDTRFSNMKRPLVNNTTEKCIGVITRGTYQESSEEIRWEYEPVYALWPYIEPDTDSSVDGSSEKGGKYQENLDDKYQEEVISDPHRNPRRIIWGEQRALRHLKNENQSSKDKLCFIRKISAGSTKDKWYLIQVDMDQYDMVALRDYGVYLWRCYTRHHEECTQHWKTECCLWTDIREMEQDGTIGEMLHVNL